MNNHLDKLDKTHYNWAMKEHPLKFSVKRSNDALGGVSYHCCLACEKGWVKDCVANKHFEDADKQHVKEHVRKCKEIKKEEVNELISLATEGGENTALLEKLKEQEKENKKLKQSIQTLEREKLQDERGEYVWKYKKLVWALCNTLEKEQRQEIMEFIKCETTKPHPKYEEDDEIAWESELMVEYQKGCVDEPDPEDD